MLDAAISDMLGKSATDIENYLLETSSVDSDHCVSLLRGRLKKKSAEIIEAVNGFDLTAEMNKRARIIQEHFADIDKRIAQINKVIGRLVS